MGLSAIAAMSKNRVIGLKNQLPWHMPGDFAYFKKMTLGKTVVMGRKTYESMGKALPQRRNIVLTRDLSFKVLDAEVVYTVDALEALLRDVDDVMLIGGGQLYSDLMALVQKIYLTVIDLECEGDVFFPEIPKEFRLISAELLLKDDKNKYDCEFRVYERLI